ncbi:MAG: hypothetical protein QNJ54_23415 [Prochloraceae cyanobacterium]|nr:hypothetical protein [Prochloraceae cyanobacterium]
MSENSYIGSSFDEFLEEDNSLTEVNNIALQRVLAWQIQQAMAIFFLKTNDRD